MADLFWPGDDRAGALLSERSFLAAMVAVEAAWLDALVAGEVAPAGAADDLRGLVTNADVPALAEAAESTGNPAAPSASSSCWTHPNGSSRRRFSAPGRGSATRRCGPAGSARSASQVRR